MVDGLRNAVWRELSWLLDSASEIAAVPTNTVAAKKIGHAHFIQNKKQLPFLRIYKTKLQSDKRGLKYAGPN